jgi:hypothetical protein
MPEVDARRRREASVLRRQTVLAVSVTALDDAVHTPPRVSVNTSSMSMSIANLCICGGSEHVAQSPYLSLRTRSRRAEVHFVELLLRGEAIGTHRWQQIEKLRNLQRSD